MAIRPLKDKARIELFLRRAPELHLYELGDLDDFFWPDTTWYGREEEDELREIVLIYTGPALPTVVGLSEQPAAIRELLCEVCPLLPKRFHAHLSHGVEAVFRKTHHIQSHGRHDRMALRDTSRVGQIDGSAAARLGRGDLDELLRLYHESYPGNWFNARMLETGQYFGLRTGGRLVSAAGVHVYSESYRIAAIGNVVTQPDHRNKGYGKLVTARLCQSLLEKVEHVGLNVKTDNVAALTCYRKLGFDTAASYAEFTIEKRSRELSALGPG